jgi:NTE family protein
MKQTNKVSLVLSSGGARGLAHIGAIEELESQGFEIQAISGTSIGAVIGGIHAAGHLEAYKKWMLNLDKLDVFNLFDFTFSSQGFVKGERVFAELQKFIPDVAIESLPIHFTAVASDVTNNCEVVFDSGSLFDAMRASVAIPTIFKPFVKESQLLVDGGVVNPIPIDRVKRTEQDILVVVNLNANIPYYKEIKNREKNIEEENNYRLRISSFMEKWLSLLPKTESPKKTLGFFELLNKSFDMMQDRVAEFTLQQHKPDVLVNISRQACGTFEFYKANEMVEYGRRMMRTALEQWKTYKEASN